MSAATARLDLLVHANTEQASKSIKSLYDQMQNLVRTTSQVGWDGLNTQDIEKAALAASKLQTMLERAINVNTGKLDLSKFTRDMARSNTTLNDLKTDLGKLGPTGQKAFMDLTRSIYNAEAPMKRTIKLVDNLWTSLKNTIQWNFASSILEGFTGALSNAWNYAQNLDKTLTDIRIVSGASADEMARFAEQANRSAKELSTTTNNYAKASLIYFQQGG